MRFSRQLPGEEHPTGCASTILLVTSIYLSLGVVAFVGWGATGNIAWVVSFFAYGALLLVSLALIELWLALRVRQHFQPGDVLHMACIWICLSALSHVLGAACSQVLGLHGGINPLALLPNWSAATADSIHHYRGKKE